MNRPDPKCILIVDDEESIRMTFERFLIREGYKPVVAVSTLQEAEGVIDQYDFDLVISDIVLGPNRGTDLLKSLREKGYDCPVVMVTGYPNLESAAQAVRRGAFDYIPKPVTKETLLHFTHQALQHRRLQLEKKRLQDENRQFQHYLEAVFRSVQDAIITVDKSLNIIQVNDKARKWIAEETGQDDMTLALKSPVGTFVRACLEDAEHVLETRKEVHEHRVEYVRQDARAIVISLSAAPIEDTEGTFYGAVLSAKNITFSKPIEDVATRINFHGYVGGSPAMQEVYKLIENVGKVDATVLVTGESGTGKELAAEAIHAESTRKEKPLIKVDCASITDDLLESELFGHVKGSFTGAHQRREGLIMQADGGTLFLDEIGDISSRMQLRLLRVLQERTFYPVGQDTPVKVDVRIVAATNADLKSKVLGGSFREDLYYRLRVVEIGLPPLRARRQEVVLLATHFLYQFQADINRHITGISDQATEALTTYSYPGNVRELQHVIERACVLCNGDTIALRHLPEEIRHWETRDPVAITDTLPSPPPQQQHTPAQGVAAITEALRQADGNKALAARLLGINRSTLYRRMQRFGMTDTVN